MKKQSIFYYYYLYLFNTIHYFASIGVLGVFASIVGAFSGKCNENKNCVKVMFALLLVSVQIKNNFVQVFFSFVLSFFNEFLIQINKINYLELNIFFFIFSIIYVFYFLISCFSFLIFEYSIYFNFSIMDSKSKEETEVDLASILGADLTQMDEASLDYFSKVPIDVPVIKPVPLEVHAPAIKPRRRSFASQLGIYRDRADKLRHEMLELRLRELEIQRKEAQEYFAYVGKIEAEKKAEEEQIRLFRESIQKRLIEDPWFARTKYIRPNYYLDFDLETPIYELITTEFNALLTCYLRTGEGVFSNINLMKDDFYVYGFTFLDIIKGEFFMDFWSCFFGIIIMTVSLVESFWYCQELIFIFFVDTYWFFFIKFASEKQKARNSYKVKIYTYKFKKKDINEKFKEFRSDLMKSHFEVVTLMEYKIEKDPEEAELILEQLTNNLDINRHHTMSLISLSHELDKENNINRKLTIEERALDYRDPTDLDMVFEDEEKEASKTLLRFKGMKEYQLALAVTLERRRKFFIKRINEDQFIFLNPDISFFSENFSKNFLLELDEEDIDYIVNIMKNQFLIEFSELKNKSKEEELNDYTFSDNSFNFYTLNDKKNIKEYLELSNEELLEKKKIIEGLYAEKLNELNEIYLLKERINGANNYKRSIKK